MLRRDLASSGKSEAGESDLAWSARTDGQAQHVNKIHVGEYTPPAAEANPFALFADGMAKWPLGAEVASAAPSPLALFLAPFRARRFERRERDLCDSNGFSPSASRKARKDVSRSRSGTAQGKRRRIMHT